MIAFTGDRFPSARPAQVPRLTKLYAERRDRHLLPKKYRSGISITPATGLDQSRAIAKKPQAAIAVAVRLQPVLLK